MREEPKKQDRREALCGRNASRCGRWELEFAGFKYLKQQTVTGEKACALITNKYSWEPNTV